jgi:LmbE family N-acetylglucosaminyl deacetylase
VIADVIRSYRPEVIYCPFPGDHHRDHQATSACTGMAVTETGYTGEVWCYELWSCLWPSIGVDISSVVDFRREAVNLPRRWLTSIMSRGARAEPISWTKARRRLGRVSLRFRPANVRRSLPNARGRVIGGVP